MIGKYQHTTFHGPVIDRTICDKCKGIDIDPFPESDIFHHCVCLHFTFHFNVEDLECSSSYKEKKNMAKLCLTYAIKSAFAKCLKELSVKGLTDILLRKVESKCRFFFF